MSSDLAPRRKAKLERLGSRCGSQAEGGGGRRRRWRPARKAAKKRCEAGVEGWGLGASVGKWRKVGSRVDLAAKGRGSKGGARPPRGGEGQRA